jgi:hypothetical protein
MKIVDAQYPSLKPLSEVYGGRTFKDKMGYYYLVTNKRDATYVHAVQLDTGHYAQFRLTDEVEVVIMEAHLVKGAV